ncbi:hypothetical protein MNO14_05010 [Luteimonas sp. S4-F44]|uniref:DUF7940 domain-containing protein n=1 Tax=Luteimonas sp. S4-F44 TaxID=2925842 RepID=UPI001F535A13|nr:hypothetical protein [Luteimonas sp. S4-F44]UNK43446.1 hypothetical protein MNO14_05010 [Luteimonas sp. S4-F44]
MSEAVIVTDWRKVWRYYSTWVLALLALMPDLYATLVASGLLAGDGIPSVASWIIRCLAVAGIALRFVSQARPAKLSTREPS